MTACILPVFVVWAAHLCQLADAESTRHVSSRVGDLVIHRTGIQHEGHWSMLAEPTGVKAGVDGNTEPTSFFATLLSSMRLPVPLGDGVTASDYVDVEDPGRTAGAHVAGLFTVLERPATKEAPRMVLDGQRSFSQKLDALSTVHQMVGGLSTRALGHSTVADLVTGKSVAVSGDARFAHAAGVRAEPVDASRFLGADAAWSAVKPFAADLDFAMESEANKFLVAELAAALQAVKDMDLAAGKSVVNVVVTGLVGVDATSHLAAQALVKNVLTECSAILTARSKGAAFVQLVTLVDESADVAGHVGALLRDLLAASNGLHRIQFPHIYIPYASTIAQVCKEVSRALGDKEAMFSVDCPDGDRLVEGHPTNSRRRATQLAVTGNTLGSAANPNEDMESYVWQFQMFFWLTVLFVILVLVVSTQIAGLDPGYETSIIYRMTPGQGMR